MMDVPLTTWLLLRHVERHFADTELVGQVAPGQVTRSTYGRFAGRAQQLMHALDALGTSAGARVATLSWNSLHHLEAYYAIPCTGRVIHTVNARLSPDEIGYLIGHAHDEVILVDPDLLAVLEQVGDLHGAKVVVMADAVPDTTLTGVLAYEDLLADQPTTYPQPDLSETTPLGLCYTSGTTGRPKGALTTHRSTFLHALAATSGGGFALSPSDSALLVVPMFHANAWGMPYSCAAAGAKQVFPGRHLDAPSLVDLLLAERATVTAGVPTVWLGVADELAKRQITLPDLREIIAGGSQPPAALIARFRREFGIPVVQAWGMTETSPLVSLARPKEEMRDWTEDELAAVVHNQAGLPLPGVEVTIRDDADVEVPWDGSSMGQLLVRGPWVIDAYEGGAGAEAFTDDGWFRTGDVAVGSPHGYFVIADRTKDLIKSGGEWISSVDMEAALMGIEGVAEAAVIAVPDPKWLERPLACVVLREGATLTLEEARKHLESAGFARWQLPDRLELIEAVPRTSVGKFDKKVLRERFPA